MKIRPYEIKDKEQLRDICAKTATAKRFQQNKELVSLLYCDYYIDNEPQNCFVLADDNNIAVGYILCSVDFFNHRNKYKTYANKAKKLSFLDYFSVWSENNFLAPVYSKYPCHMHIDILPEYQHKGYGKQLINALCEHLRLENIKNLRLTVGADNKNALAFYNRLGFKKIKNIFGVAYILVKEI